MTDANPARISYAEDSRFLRELMSKRLRDRGYLIVGAPTGDAAAAALSEAAPPDILVTDIGMPGSLDGWGLARLCRELHPGTGILYASSERPDSPLRVADSEFLPKPYGFEALLAEVERLASGRRCAAVLSPDLPPSGRATSAPC